MWVTSRQINNGYDFLHTSAPAEEDDDPLHRIPRLDEGFRSYEPGWTVQTAVENWLPTNIAENCHYLS